MQGVSWRGNFTVKAEWWASDEAARVRQPRAGREAEPGLLPHLPSGQPAPLTPEPDGPPHRSMQSDFTSAKPWVTQARVRVPIITSSPSRAAEGASGTLPPKHQLRSQVARYHVLLYQTPP